MEKYENKTVKYHKKIKKIFAILKKIKFELFNICIEQRYKQYSSKKFKYDSHTHAMTFMTFIEIDYVVLCFYM